MKSLKELEEEKNARRERQIRGLLESLCPHLKCAGSERTPIEHAVSSRDDVLGGHQGSGTELTTSSGDYRHHPGIFVDLKENSFK